MPRFATLPCRRTTILATLCVALLGAGCAQLPGQEDSMRADTPVVRLDTARLAEIDRAILDNIAARKLPGAVFHLEHLCPEGEGGACLWEQSGDAPLVTASKPPMSWLQ